MVDTEVEIPQVVSQAGGFLGQAEQWARAENLPVSVHVLTPVPEESFWGLVIGKGYLAPHHFYRWCVSKLKIRPVRRYLKAIEDEVVVCLGSRREESDTRRRLLGHRVKAGDHWGPFEGVPNARALYPIIDWTTGEVWDYLLKVGPPWGGHYTKLFGLYWEALDECLFRPNANGFSCNGRRFGCWTCTVVKRDKTLENLIAFSNQDSLRELMDFKNRLRSLSQDRSRRLPLTRRGTLGPGPFTIETRKMILEELRNLEDKIGTQLVSHAQLQFITSMWEVDAHASICSERQ